MYACIYVFIPSTLFLSRAQTNTACLSAMFYMLTNQHTMSKSFKTYSQASDGHRGTNDQVKLKYCIYN